MTEGLNPGERIIFLQDAIHSAEVVIQLEEQRLELLKKHKKGLEQQLKKLMDEVKNNVSNEVQRPA